MDEVQLGSRTLQPRRQLIANGQRVALGRRALDIVSVLAEAKGGIVTKEELFDAVWPGVVVEENALQVHIAALRKALGSEADRLRTIRGVGYQLEIEDGTRHCPPRLQNGSSAPNPSATGAAPAYAPPSRPMWRTLRRFPHALVIAAVTAVLLASGWLAAGPLFALQEPSHTAVVFRPLTAVGTLDPTEKALANAITNDLTVSLRELPALRVATAEADGSVPLDTFRDAYVVAGFVDRSGDRVRVTARLSNAAGEPLWSQTFDRPLADLFGVQQSIAASIAHTLGMSFETGGKASDFGGTEAPQAFASYLQFLVDQANPVLTEQGRLDQSKAIDDLERALAIDPNYVDALTALSGYDGLRASMATTREESLAWLDRMDANTAKAVTAEPGLWTARAARVEYFFRRTDFRSADREMRRMARLDDGTDPQLRLARASDAMAMGRTSTALALLDSVGSIDPVRRDDAMRVMALANAGRLREAIAAFDRLPEEKRGMAGMWAFYANLKSGGPDAALPFARKNMWSDGGLQTFKGLEPMFLSMSTEGLEQWMATWPGGRSSAPSFAVFASFDGHPKLAVDLLRLSSGYLSGFQIIYLWSPLMADTRKTDEFEQLVADLGLVAAWRESGDWGDYCRPVSPTEISCH